MCCFWPLWARSCLWRIKTSRLILRSMCHPCCTLPVKRDIELRVMPMPLRNWGVCLNYDLYFFLFNLSYVGSVAAEWQGSHWRERSDAGRISTTYRSGFIDKPPRYPRPAASSTGFLAKTVSFWMHTSEINILLRKLLSCTCLMMWVQIHMIGHFLTPMTDKGARGHRNIGTNQPARVRGKIYWRFPSPPVSTRVQFICTGNSKDRCSRQRCENCDSLSGNPLRSVRLLHISVLQSFRSSVVGFKASSCILRHHSYSVFFFRHLDNSPTSNRSSGDEFHRMVSPLTFPSSFPLQPWLYIICFVFPRLRLI